MTKYEQEQAALELFKAAKKMAQMNADDYADAVHKLEAEGWKVSEAAQECLIAWGNVVSDIRALYDVYGQPAPTPPTKAS